MSEINQVSVKGSIYDVIDATAVHSVNGNTPDAQGNVAVTRADLNAVDEAEIAYIETTMVATRAYAVGQYITINGVLYKTIAEIDIDDALDSTNVVAVATGGLNDLSTDMTGLITQRVKTINGRSPNPITGDIVVIEGGGSSSYGSYRIDTTIEPSRWTLDTSDNLYKVTITSIQIAEIVTSTMDGSETWLDDESVMLGETTFTTYDGGVTVATTVLPTATWNLHIALAMNGATVLADMTNKIDEAKGDVAYLEKTNTASRSYVVGQYVVWNGVLCKVAQAISSGDTLNNTKLTAINGGLGAEVESLNSNLKEKIPESHDFTTVKSLVDKFSGKSAGTVLLFSGNSANCALLANGETGSGFGIAKYTGTVIAYTLCQPSQARISSGEITTDGNYTVTFKDSCALNKTKSVSGTTDATGDIALGLNTVEGVPVAFEVTGGNMPKTSVRIFQQNGNGDAWWVKFINDSTLQNEANKTVTGTLHYR